MVGSFTKIVGGKANNSPSGLNALLITIITGNIINIPSGINII